MPRAGGKLEKLERSSEILAKADELFRERSFDAITMGDLASALGLAKGTLYLYFPSKESLFLALLDERLGEAFECLFEKLEQAPLGAGDPVGRAAESIASVMAADPCLPRLLAIASSVLEGRLPFEEAVTFKRGRAAALKEAGERLAAAVPGLEPARGARFFAYLYAQVVGLAGVTDVSPFMRRVGELPGLELFRLGFEETLCDTARALLAGVMAGPARGRGEGDEA